MPGMSVIALLALGLGDVRAVDPPLHPPTIRALMTNAPKPAPRCIGHTVLPITRNLW